MRRGPVDSFLLRLTPGLQVIEGRGTLDLTAVVGARPGVEIPWAGATYRIVRPQLSDRLAHLRRRAQIVTPKDAAFLWYLAGVGPGSTVVEVGAGSGALTVLLAHAVGDAGHVISYDRRPDFRDVAERNVAAAGFASRVEFRLRPIGEQPFDLDPASAGAVIADVPAPWEIVPHAIPVLVPGGALVLYTPTYNQLEHAVRELRSHGFEETRSVELLERALHVGDGGTRPDFEMLGHTGFLTGSRWFGGRR
ncbi:MAG: methyltransferase domain-containing protein [Thermoplasmata archaeon]|nr:methyltransferase domain-containing protein [Thermoplasmata archaeon]